jgi:16S rRNA (cytidine1402-2'-O)-methyltransferase
MHQSESVRPSTLYIVATPIGHLDDITLRAKSVLGSVERICCEDTRHSARLLEHLSIHKPLVSLHEHNEADRSAQVVAWLQAGESIALVSDAGTPLISDPGYVLVNAVIEAGCQVVPVPGVSAAITAMSASGLPTDRWSFQGFLSNRQAARTKQIEALASQEQTMVFYESSHRIQDCLADMSVVMGSERRVVVARELTKTFETFLRGSLGEVLEVVEQDPNQRKGEFVVILDGNKNAAPAEASPEIISMLEELKPLLPPKKAAAVVANVFGGSKKQYYDMLLNM